MISQEIDTTDPLLRARVLQLQNPLGHAKFHQNHTLLWADEGRLYQIRLSPLVQVIDIRICRIQLPEPIILPPLSHGPQTHLMHLKHPV
jgi:hypothetical protein